MPRPRRPSGGPTRPAPRRSATGPLPGAPPALRRGRLLSFRPRDWTGVVRLDASLASVRLPALESLSGADLATGDKVAVLMFHLGDRQDGLILGSYGNVGGGASDILTDANGDVLSDSNGDVLFG